MSFQQRPQRRTPRCPWCDQEMVPSPDSRGGRLFCPTGESVEYRVSGGRWYFNGRLNGLDEPIPPAPGGGLSTDDDDEFVASSTPTHPHNRSSSLPVPLVPSTPSTPPEPPDAMDAFRRIARDAWDAPAAADEAG